MIGKTIYDTSMDELREATQEDVDRVYKSLSVARLMVLALRRLKPELLPHSGVNFQDDLQERLYEFMPECRPLTLPKE